MAAIDFPNPPLTVGQTFAASNGVTYKWDGAVWVSVPAGSAPPTGPAGGDLAGTYPNPVIAVPPWVDSSFTTGGANLNTFFTLASFALGTLQANRLYRVQVNGEIARAAGGIIVVIRANGVALMSISEAGTVATYTYAMDCLFCLASTTQLRGGGTGFLATTQPTNHQGVSGTAFLLRNTMTPSGMPGAVTLTIEGQFTTANASNSMDKSFASVERL
jgi:hypothetical protein